MISTSPIESFGDLVERFPGINELDPVALGRFAFHAAVHKPNEDMLYPNPSEERHSWQDRVCDIIYEIKEWREYDRGQTSRLEVANRIAHKIVIENETTEFIETIADKDSRASLEILGDFFKRNGVYIKAYRPASPMFPEGRTVNKPMELTSDFLCQASMSRGEVLVDRHGNEIDTDIVDFLEYTYPRKRASEIIGESLEGLEIDRDKLERLRLIYGAKGANLLCFEEKVAELNETTGDSLPVINIEVPDFLAVSVDMYKAWLEDPKLFEKMCEQARQGALDLLVRKEYEDIIDLVAVRSSAVKSEDGDEHSGAGVYTSLCVDPRDQEAFRSAVVSVYESTNSHSARTYQKDIGVDNEVMGLVIQRYQEGKYIDRDTYFGHINSQGINPNIIEIHTNEGILYYDKSQVRENLLIYPKDRFNGGSYMHTSPDHRSKLSSAAHRTNNVPHAVVLAEKLFGRPMQLEFVDNVIVQARPLKTDNIEALPISFPEDIESVADCSATGIGDMELDRLDGRSNNTEKTGFIIVWQEYGFTIGRSGASYDSFPKEGAVVVMNPSSSGHIQAICREKGLLCFFPKKGTSIEHIEDLIFPSNDGLQSSDGFSNEPVDIKFRFVADGYDGRIYKV